MTRVPLISLVFRIPRAHLEALKALSARTRIRQSEYLREALVDLLEKYRGGFTGVPKSVAGEVATHVLVPEQHGAELRQLAERTRVNQSDYLLEAVEDLLAKYSTPAPQAAGAGGSP